MTRASCSDVADFFIALANVSGEPITNLKLQKLVYYSQAWHLAIWGKPLFSGHFEAWVHGPVCPTLYQQYKAFRWMPIEKDLDEEDLKKMRKAFGPTISEFLDEVAEEYMGMTAYDLERLVHSEGPWQWARGPLPEDAPSRNVIHDEWMKEFYESFVVRTDGKEDY